jgi:acetyl esterase/lipase
MKEMVFMSRAVDLLNEFGAIVVSPGYRLAWQEPYPAAAEDCYSALRWLYEHAEEYGGNKQKIIVGGESAGGGLAISVCMMARDSGEIPVRFQLPLYPMIDNFDTESSRFNQGKVWNTRRNHLGWNLYLRRNAKKEVSPYASPSRQKDLAGMPPCYTFVGDGEPFYSETLDYVRRLKESGVRAQIDVYHTDCHAFDMLYPENDLSKQAIRRFIDNCKEIM